MRRLWCRIFGHAWRPVYGGRTRRSACLVCIRCRENGWLV